MSDRMRVAVIGMGAIGHLFARALAGRAEIVRVDKWTAPPRAKERPAAVAIVATKTPGTGWAAEVALSMLLPDGLALTIQNGLGNAEVLAASLGADRVARGVVYVGAQLRSDGSLSATGPGRVEVGRPSGVAAAAQLDRLAALLRDGGMTVEVVDDLGPVVWRKLVVNAAVNGLTALLACTNAEFLTHPTGRVLADGLARETARVATALGVPIGEAEAVRLWPEIVASFSANPLSSMRQDAAAGRPTEVEAINGAVAREGRRIGVPTPLNDAITTLVAALSAGGAVGARGE